MKVPQDFRGRCISTFHKWPTSAFPADSQHEHEVVVVDGDVSGSIEPSSSQEPQDAKSEGVSSSLVAYIHELHKRLPVSMQAVWLNRMRGSLIRLLQFEGDDSTELSTGSACSGVDIYMHGLRGCLDEWASNYGAEDLGVQLEHKFACDIACACQTFSDYQHNPKVFVNDVKHLGSARVYNRLTKKMTVVPRVALFIAGFSCKCLSKMNSKRKTGSVKDEIGETGATFHNCFEYIKRNRPVMSIMENVPDIKNTFEVNEVSTSDLEHMQTLFEDISMTFLWAEIQAMSHGSAQMRSRIYMIALDLAPSKAKAMNLDKEFKKLLTMLRMPAREPKDFLLTEAEKMQLCKGMDWVVKPPSKKVKADLNWKLVHEQFFSRAGIEWPPNVSHLVAEFLQREAEVAVAANIAFPETQVGVWRWFDTNHTMERSLHFPLEEEDSEMTNPWKLHVPCFTCNSAVVGRMLAGDGTVSYRRLHVLEGFSMMGWSPDCWKSPPFLHLTYAELQTMLGNMWSMYHFVPVLCAIAGAVDWSHADDPDPSAFATEQSETGESSSSDSD